MQHSRKRKVVGVHIRAGDRLNIAPLSTYFSAVDAYIKIHPNASIFLATDDQSVAHATLQRYGMRLKQQMSENLILVHGRADIRSSYSHHIVWRQVDSENADRRGMQVLLDTLLL